VSYAARRTAFKEQNLKPIVGHHVVECPYQPSLVFRKRIHALAHIEQQLHASSQGGHGQSRQILQRPSGGYSLNDPLQIEFAFLNVGSKR
jgi:hypothetical protein